MEKQLPVKRNAAWLPGVILLLVGIFLLASGALQPEPNNDLQVQTPPNDTTPGWTVMDYLGTILVIIGVVMIFKMGKPRSEHPANI
jgi:uncharacterized membrane protein HdeD (DUF308 family)